MFLPIPTGTTRSLAALRFVIAVMRFTSGVHALFLEGFPSVRNRTTRFASARYPGQLAQMT